MELNTNLKEIKDMIIKCTNDNNSINDTFNLTLTSIKWVDMIYFHVICTFDVEDKNGIREIDFTIRNKFKMNYEYIKLSFDLLIYTINEYLYKNNTEELKDDIILIKYLKDKKDTSCDNYTDIVLLALVIVARELYHLNALGHKLPILISPKNEKRIEKIIEDESINNTEDKEFIINLYKKLVDKLYETIESNTLVKEV